MDGIANSLQRAIDNDVALHYLNAPAHASAIARNLTGAVRGLTELASDDPLIIAYQMRDRLPEIAGYVIALQKWCDAVIESTPDQIQDNGAQLCR